MFKFRDTAQCCGVVLETRDAGPHPCSQPHSPPLSCMCLPLQLPSVCNASSPLPLVRPMHRGLTRHHLLQEAATVPSTTDDVCYTLSVLYLNLWTGGCAVVRSLPCLCSLTICSWGRIYVWLFLGNPVELGRVPAIGTFQKGNLTKYLWEIEPFSVGKMQDGVVVKRFAGATRHRGSWKPIKELVLVLKRMRAMDGFQGEQKWLTHQTL